MITIRVAGLPAPQGSKRHVGNGRMVESSKAVAPWREAVRAEAQRVLAADKHRYLSPWLANQAIPVAIEIAFTLPRPKGHYGTGRNAHTVRPSAPMLPAGRPDLDKLGRAVLDGLVMGGAIPDDAQVTCLQLTKEYGQPGALITIGEDKI